MIRLLLILLFLTSTSYASETTRIYKVLKESRTTEYHRIITLSNNLEAYLGLCPYHAEFHIANNQIVNNLRYEYFKNLGINFDLDLPVSSMTVITNKLQGEMIGAMQAVRSYVKNIKNNSLLSPQSKKFLCDDAIILIDTNATLD
jgi:hypothetical protein